MKRLLAPLGILAMAACSSAPPPAQTSPQQPWVPTPPVYALIGQRQELSLTSAQVTALDSIGVSIQTRNQPVLDEIRELQPTGFRRRMNAQDMERMRPLVDSVRENNRRGQEAVRTLLSEEQRTAVCRMYAPDRAERRRREAMQRQARQAPRGRFDSDTVSAGFRGPWSWCGTQSATTAPPDSAARPVRTDSTVAVTRPDSTRALP